MEKEAIHFLNGKLVKESDLVISIRDLGFMRGYALFDFLITYQGQKPFMLDRHIDRFFRSAELMGMKLPWSKDQVRRFVTDTLSENNDGKQKSIKIVASGGVSSQKLLPEGEPTLAVIVDTRKPVPEEYYTKGIGATTVKFRRYLPEAKSNNYIEAVMAAQAAAATGAIEPIFYDDTQVYEGAISNVFAVIGNRLTTPKSNILGGITREVLLKILPAENYPVAERDFTIGELRGASEIFLAASDKEVMPVTTLDGKPVGDGTVGLTTKEVMARFRAFTDSDKW